MIRLAVVLALSLLAGLAIAAPSSGHVGAGPHATAALAPSVDPRTDPFTVGLRPPTWVDGPCTQQSRNEQYVEGDGHDHLEISQHRFACQMVVRHFNPLLQQTDNPATPVEDPDEILGEMDVKGDVAAVAISYPRAGILFFDVSNVAQPKFISRYRGAECEGLAIDVDCGAFVDMSADGRTAFLSVQQISVVPGGNPGLNEPAAVPGVDVVDVRTGRLTGRLPIESVGGVHTSRSHVIQPGPSTPQQPREPGEYVFSIANGLGIEVSKVVTAPTGKTLQKVGRIDIDETHDTFLQDDPLTGRTLMYVAAGFDTGFYVYDVTAPSRALGSANSTLLAEWDLTPECEQDWYSHTIDVATRNGRRFVTMPAELFENGATTAADRQNGCGAVQGNGDKAGPMWIVDATDFKALGQGSFADSQDNATAEAATDKQLKAASQATLVTTWTNAADREGENLNFSPHNQQIVGDRIYLSNYHAGVTVLDASAAFRGENVRPRETSFLVPSGTPTRPIYRPIVDPLVLPFFQNFIDFRPLVWDMFAHRGHLLAADMTGGFYSLLETNPPTPAEQAVQPVEQPLREAQAQQRRCNVATGFRSVGARGRGRGVRLSFRRLRNRPVAVDVFAVSAGRAVLGERRVARFARRARSFTWNGRANVRGRRVRNGYYLVRFRMALGGGRADVRRVVLRRQGGRFVRRPGSYRRASCGLLSSYKLERPVFGGPRNRALGISFRLSDPAAVTVTVLRGRRVVRRFEGRARRANQTHRLRFDAENRPRGDYRVVIEAVGGPRRVVATLTARRI